MDSTVLDMDSLDEVATTLAQTSITDSVTRMKRAHNYKEHPHDRTSVYICPGCIPELFHDNGTSNGWPYEEDLGPYSLKKKQSTAVWPETQWTPDRTVHREEYFWLLKLTKYYTEALRNGVNCDDCGVQVHRYDKGHLCFEKTSIYMESVARPLELLHLAERPRQMLNALNDGKCVLLSGRNKASMLIAILEYLNKRQITTHVLEPDAIVELEIARVNSTSRSKQVIETDETMVVAMCAKLVCGCFDAPHVIVADKINLLDNGLFSAFADKMVCCLRERWPGMPVVICRDGWIEHVNDDNTLHMVRTDDMLKCEGEETEQGDEETERESEELVIAIRDNEILILKVNELLSSDILGSSLYGKRGEEMEQEDEETEQADEETEQADEGMEQGGEEMEQGDEGVEHKIEKRVLVVRDGEIFVLRVDEILPGDEVYPFLE